MICINCNKEYEPPKQRGRKSPYCCEACKTEYQKIHRKTYTRVCGHCGTEFESVRRNQKYCSTECSHAASKTGRTVYTKTCLYCGKEFQTIHKDHKYCTSTCAARHAGDQHKGEYFCEYCGKPRYSDHPNRNRFCSRECANKAKRIVTQSRRAQFKKIHITTMTRSCDYCGSDFVAKNGANRFCCQECRRLGILEEQHAQNEANFIAEERVCPHCGKSFRTTLQAQDKQYCSEWCRNRAQHTRQKEVRRQLMGQAFVEPVGLIKTYNAYKGYCAICGLPVPATTDPSNQWAATVDHITPLSRGGLHCRDNCQLAHRMCNSVKLDSGDEFFIDWEHKLIEEPGRWNSQLDDLWKQLDEEKRHDEVAV